MLYLALCQKPKLMNLLHLMLMRLLDVNVYKQSKTNKKMMPQNVARVKRKLLMFVYTKVLMVLNIKVTWKKNLLQLKNHSN